MVHKTKKQMKDDLVVRIMRDQRIKAALSAALNNLIMAPASAVRGSDRILSQQWLSVANTTLRDKESKSASRHPTWVLLALPDDADEVKMRLTQCHLSTLSTVVQVESIGVLREKLQKVGLDVTPALEYFYSAYKEL